MDHIIHPLHLDIETVSPVILQEKKGEQLCSEFAISNFILSFVRSIINTQCLLSLTVHKNVYIQVVSLFPLSIEHEAKKIETK